jgi:hypothetical protein
MNGQVIVKKATSPAMMLIENKFGGIGRCEERPGGHCLTLPTLASEVSETWSVINEDQQFRELTRASRSTTLPDFDLLPYHIHLLYHAFRFVVLFNRIWTHYRCGHDY